MGLLTLFKSIQILAVVKQLFTLAETLTEMILGFVLSWDFWRAAVISGISFVVAPNLLADLGRQGLGEYGAMGVHSLPY